MRRLLALPFHRQGSSCLRMIDHKASGVLLCMGRILTGNFADDLRINAAKVLFLKSHGGFPTLDREVYLMYLGKDIFLAPRSWCCFLFRSSKSLL